MLLSLVSLPQDQATGNQNCLSSAFLLQVSVWYVSQWEPNLNTVSAPTEHRPSVSC